MSHQARPWYAPWSPAPRRVSRELFLCLARRFASGESHGERRDRDEEEFRRFLLEATKLEGGGPRAASLLVVGE